jgi:hypothetical protein
VACKWFSRWLAVTAIGVGTLCGCATSPKKAQVTVLALSFYSDAEKAAPFISLRGDRKLFVIRAKADGRSYGYDGKFFNVTREDAADLKKRGLELFKMGQPENAVCTNGIRLSVSVEEVEGKRILCVMPGKNSVVDGMFEAVNDLLDEESQIVWK